MLDLVFEGGGTKALAYLGALQELEDYEPQLRRLVGSSAGAMIAMLLALGYNSRELNALLNSKGASLLSSFFDVPLEFDDETRDQSLLWDAFRQVDLPLVPERLEAKLDRALFTKLCRVEPFRLLFSLVECGGLFEGRVMYDWLCKAIVQKGFEDRVTFQELLQQTGIDLSVVVGDTTAQRKLVLNAKTAPRFPIAWAVRASMSIPFVWQAVKWEPTWGPYLDADMSEHELVDGGIISNFALDLLMTDSIELGPLPTDGYAFGFLLDEQLVVPGIKPALPSIQLKTIDRLMRTVDTVMNASDNHAIVRFPDRVCRLPCKAISTLATDLKRKQIDLLVDAARQATRLFLASNYPIQQRP